MPESKPHQGITMSRSQPASCNRRRFLAITTAGAAIYPLSAARHAWADEPGAAPPPRATSGDSVEPVWKDRLTISVGPKEADLIGKTDRVLQAEVDYVARLGGGTVRVLPGEYRLRNAVYLASKVRIVGSGDDSVLIKEPSVSTRLSADADWYDQEITLTDAAGFKVGDGVCLRARNADNGAATVAKRILIAKSGNRFKLDRALRENFWQKGEASVATLFPIFSGDNIADVSIANITLDGNRDQNENLDGNYAGCVFLQDCKQIALRGVTARRYTASVGRSVMT